MGQPECASKTSETLQAVLGVGSESWTTGGHISIYLDSRGRRSRILQLAKHKQSSLASTAKGRTRDAARPGVLRGPERPLRSGAVGRPAA